MALKAFTASQRFGSIDGHSRCRTALIFWLNRETIAKMCQFSLPQRSTSSKPVEKLKFGLPRSVIDAIQDAGRIAHVRYTTAWDATRKPASLKGSSTSGAQVCREYFRTKGNKTQHFETKYRASVCRGLPRFAARYFAFLGSPVHGKNGRWIGGMIVQPQSR